MSEQQVGSKRKVWIGVGAAVVAVVVASQFVDFGSGGKDAAGTIVPAQRYRAEQPATTGVQGGGATGTASAPVAPASSASDGRAADGRAADGRAADGRAADGRAADGRAADGRAATTR